jgi:DNA-binding NarL/FixJ family response regulator
VGTATGVDPIVDDVRVAPRLLLIVEDHAQFASFVRQLLDGEEFHVVGVSASGEDALATIRALSPECVLLDVQLPGMDGFEVAQRLAAGPSPPAVVLTSTRDATDFGARLAAAPIAGFVTKQDLSVAALVAALSGG